MIEASVSQQYGVRLRQEIDTIRWSEVSVLIHGLLPSTPLGKIVSIRAETDKEMLKNYTPSMRAIRSKWLSRMAQDKLTDLTQLDMEFEAMDNLLRQTFGDN